ncbi:GTP-binding protein HflX [Thermodesulfitimonas autotrophica]|uniref:GTPase HflX n=1 Tax=Thermodesulfitimonas autotrophica TaxID=1894989 RepID=A0A3N5AY58_9THEO|nr:GTPase HflX [Thermodesulfitimonas autotrophica]RPF49853.1 GTP-binding protein HflX [Thermodesulfitimonas autotrophica]
MKRGIICYLATREGAAEIAYDLTELQELLRNIEIEAAATVVQHREPDLNYFFGEGKIREVKEQVDREGYEAVVFNRELSPRQVKALEDLFGAVEVWDRTQVILEIFRRRAHSREGKIQVELARLTYLYPRLYGLGGALSRLGGGIGTRGPGETKLEILRRALRERIHDLRRELEAVRKNRALLRKQRQEEGLPTVALVGYTNAGKSTLLNALAVSDQKVLAEDRLFATLDPVSRRVRLPSGRFFLLTDTVGFIKELPPKLKEAFKATLEELASAHLLLHVIDLTSPYLDEQVAAVEKLLEELNLTDRPLLKVYNKVDRYAGILPENGIVISALTGINLSTLQAEIEALLFPEKEAVLLIPFDRLGELSRCRERLRVLKEEYLPEGVRLTVQGRPEDIARLTARLKN